MANPGHKYDNAVLRVTSEDATYINNTIDGTSPHDYHLYNNGVLPLPAEATRNETSYRFGIHRQDNNVPDPLTDALLLAQDLLSNIPFFLTLEDTRSLCDS